MKNNECPFCKKETDCVLLKDNSGKLISCDNCEADFYSIENYNESNITCFKTDNFSIKFFKNKDKEHTRISNENETRLIACVDCDLGVENLSLNHIDDKIKKIISFI